MNAHCADDAELYALGLTDPERGAAIEAHCALCPDCRARVIAAEAAAAALAAALPPAGPAVARTSRFGGTALAAAAALVFAAAAGIEALALHDGSERSARAQVALTAIASSHFNHVTLASAPGSAVKTIYARDGGWIYIIAQGMGAGVHAVVRRDGAEQDIGPLAAGSPATLFLRAPGRVDEVLLIDAGRTVARGTLAY